jgi:anti-sigma-K factor RskA
LIGYASFHKKNPRPELRQAVLDKIDEAEGYDSRIIPLPQARQSAGSFRYLMAAVIAFLVLNIIASVFMYYKWQGTERQLASLVEENKNMRNEYEKVKQTLDKKSNDMHMVINRLNKVVNLNGMEASPGSMATVYWNPESKKVMLNVEKLPKPPENMQFQLWALKDGKPIDAGVFDMTDDPMHMMDTPIESADAFAVTLEKMGGSPEPTLSRLYVMGKL